MIKRCDYKGRNYNAFDDIDKQPEGNLDKFIPEGCAHELGGVIGAEADATGNNRATDTTLTFTATISPRYSGVHTFWVGAKGGAFLFITDSSGAKSMVVNNSGFHPFLWMQGAITLAQGERYELKVYWGNGAGTGKLQVQFEDPLSDGSAVSSLAPILA